MSFHQQLYSNVWPPLLSNLQGKNALLFCSTCLICGSLAFFYSIFPHPILFDPKTGSGQKVFRLSAATSLIPFSPPMSPGDSPAVRLNQDEAAAFQVCCDWWRWRRRVSLEAECSQVLHPSNPQPFPLSLVHSWELLGIFCVSAKLHPAFSSASGLLWQNPVHFCCWCSHY